MGQTPNQQLRIPTPVTPPPRDFLTVPSTLSPFKLIVAGHLFLSMSKRSKAQVPNFDEKKLLTGVFEIFEEACTLLTNSSYVSKCVVPQIKIHRKTYQIDFMNQFISKMFKQHVSIEKVLEWLWWKTLKANSDFLEFRIVEQQNSKLQRKNQIIKPCTV